ncbi:MAG: hypothetical protein COW71_05875 [Ignavibacteriales bacterium CG18_big_fil_WC_8_21_14_2_50_31_20]|nr:MAG: hypothetical protein COW71_05875 [Ignavibacteriales bacterium CG18_big_fil_WC_8_21_14_2_50_31_20]
MKKLKLNLDDLKVESFETTNSLQGLKGTVNGQGPLTIVTEPDIVSQPCQCYDPTSDSLRPTCDATCLVPTCANTCAHTCADTCGMSCDCGTWPNPAICTD